MQVIRLVGWLACCVYCTIPAFWLLIHPTINTWRKRRLSKRTVYQLLLPVWILMWILAAWLSSASRKTVIYENWLAVLIGAALIACGALCYSLASRGFSRTQLIGQSEIDPGRHEQRLVVTGIRNRVRHPIYLGHLLEMMGWSILSGVLANFLLTAFAVATGFLMVRLEEQELLERFGEEYRQYQQRVPALLPRIG